MIRGQIIRPTGLIERLFSSYLGTGAVLGSHHHIALGSLGLHINIGPITLPNISDLLPGILKAVPKKKPSYRRTRQKLYAPGDKQIQPLNNIVRCPACGSVKRSHFMCMNCFGEIKQFLKSFKPSAQKPNVPELDKVDEQILYPGKKMTDYQRKLAKKDYIPIREKPLMYKSDQLKLKK